jgi:hypothetical protein
MIVQYPDALIVKVCPHSLHLTHGSASAVCRRIMSTDAVSSLKQRGQMATIAAY